MWIVRPGWARESTSPPQSLVAQQVVMKSCWRAGGLATAGQLVRTRAESKERGGFLRSRSCWLLHLRLCLRLYWRSWVSGHASRLFHGLLVRLRELGLGWKACWQG